MSELRVALTFDAEHPSRAGAEPTAPVRILDALDAADVRATFFVQGRWASAHPPLARRIADDGHLVGNHSNYHAPMTLLSAAGIRTDVREAERRIGEATGTNPRPWFRCPFGDGENSPGVQAALTGLGYRIVPWDLDAGDWRDDATPDSVQAAVLEGVVDRVQEQAESCIVLLHTWPEATATALTGLLARLVDRGAVFVSVPSVPEVIHGA